MIIHTLELHHFRNYSHVEVAFSPELNFIQGNNGQGKTNIVEALYYLCNLDSFRTRKILPLLQNQQEFALLKSSIERKNVLYAIQINLSKKGKKVLLNQKHSRKTSEHILSFISIAFTPEDVNLFRSIPNERRRFFDRTLSFVDSSYFFDMQELNQILAQKNALLKRKNIGQLPIWNELLSKISQKVGKQRHAFVVAINRHLTGYFRKMTGRSEKLLLTYQPSFGEETYHNQQQMNEALQRIMERELNYGHTLLGPHRDDYRLFLDNKGDRDFFSQGELRITNLSLKMSINQLLSERYSFYPVLIFDDLFSELDPKVNGKVLQFFSELKNQIFITSTDVPPNLTLHGKTIHIANGQLSHC